MSSEHKTVIYIRLSDEKYSHFELVEKGKAEFVQYGIDYDQLDNGVGMFTTAVIKLPDGTIKNIPVEQIKFVECHD